MNPFSLCASFFLGLLILSVTSFYAFHKTTHKCDLSCVAVNCYILYENNYDEGECLCFDNDELYCFDKLEKDVDGYAEYTNFCLIIFFSYIGLSMINLICCCLLDNNYYSSNNDRLTINKKLTTFLGQYETIEEIKNRARKFILDILEWQRFQTAGTSLEPSLPLTLGNNCEELV